MGFMTAFGWASIMLGIGMFLRAKISFLRNMLVPASVIGGACGFIFINLYTYLRIDIGSDIKSYTEIVNHLFTASFISIGLTNTSGKEKNSSNNIFKGTIALGLIWCLLYALTPILATGVIAVMKPFTDMDTVYGMLIQFAFCQGPGQAATYGIIFEQYGWKDAASVAIAFSVIGFIAAFFIGIPAARVGIKRGIAHHCGRLDKKTLSGYLKIEEQTEYMIKDTTCNSNIETLTFHFMLIGICFILAVCISDILRFILPGFLGESMSSMMFMNGMYAAYFVRWLMRKLKIDFLQNNILQSKITGWSADYLVVCAFMSVSVNVIGKWWFSILIVSFAITIITAITCFYFGARIGGEYDFERTLGIYGACTGTVPSGVSLIRIVDPDFKTAAYVELGACNLVMMASTPVYIVVLALASGNMKMGDAIGCLSICVLLYLFALKLTKSWGSKTYSWKS